MTTQSDTDRWHEDQAALAVADALDRAKALICAIGEILKQEADDAEECVNKISEALERYRAREIP